MIQLVAPNLSVAGQPDYCLLYVQTCFGAPAISPTAWAAWNATQFKHEDRNLPNIAVPLWFEWYGTVEGVTDNFGHVALWTGSEIYTNPLSGSGHEVFPTIEALEQAYGVQFVGWSEDIETLRVVKEVQMITKEDEEVLSQIATGDNPGNDYDYRFTGTAEWDACLNFWLGYSQVPELRKSVDSLTAANLKLTDQLKNQPSTDPNSVVITKDGFWASLLAFLKLK